MSEFNPYKSPSSDVSKDLQLEKKGRTGFFRSLFKIFVVTIISIILFIVLIPLISMMVNKGYGAQFFNIMLVVLIVGVVLDRMVKRKR